MVAPTHRIREIRIFRRAQKEPQTRIEEGGIDSFGVHVGDTRVRVEAALAPLGIRNFGRDLAAARPKSTDSAETDFLLAATERDRVIAFDSQNLLAAFQRDQFGALLAILGLGVLLL